MLPEQGHHLTNFDISALEPAEFRHKARSFPLGKFRFSIGRFASNDPLYGAIHSESAPGSQPCQGHGKTAGNGLALEAAAFFRHIVGRLKSGRTVYTNEPGSGQALPIQLVFAGPGIGIICNRKSYKGHHPAMNISEPSSRDRTAAIWQLAFRPGFLAAATFAILAMLRWSAWLLWPGSLPEELPAQWWHAHEMIFGFALPVVAGFLLTAVATWTGIQGTRGRRLQVLFGSWLLARLVLWLSPGELWLAWIAEMLFLFILLWELGQRVVARRQWRNIIFLPVLLLLALFNTGSYLHVQEPPGSLRWHYGAVWFITLLVVVIGGRVIPLFTGNRLNIRMAALPPWFDYLCIGAVALVGLDAIFSITQGTTRTGLYLATAGIHLYRMATWQGYRTLGVPLLWSMHLSYLCIPLALVCLGWPGIDLITEKNLMHLLAVGAVGGMILTMMSRVSLGHTGRVLEIPPYLAFAFALLLLAAMLRSFLPLLDTTLTRTAWHLSAAMWVIAFALFLWHYIPILTRPRVDGKPG